MKFHSYVLMNALKNILSLRNIQFLLLNGLVECFETRPIGYGRVASLWAPCGNPTGHRVGCVTLSHAQAMFLNVSSDLALCPHAALGGFTPGEFLLALGMGNPPRKFKTLMRVLRFPCI